MENSCKSLQIRCTAFLIFSGRSCGRTWTFERFIDRELAGHVDQTVSCKQNRILKRNNFSQEFNLIQVRGVTKGECEDRCLSESVCLSASYDHVRQECHLSREDRFTKPNDFVVRQGVDYLENQCQSGKTGFSCSTQGFRTLRTTV